MMGDMLKGELILLRVCDGEGFYEMEVSDPFDGVLAFGFMHRPQCVSHIPPRRPGAPATTTTHESVWFPCASTLLDLFSLTTTTTAKTQLFGIYGILHSSYGIILQ